MGWLFSLNLMFYNKKLTVLLGFLASCFMWQLFQAKPVLTPKISEEFQDNNLAGLGLGSNGKMTRLSWPTRGCCNRQILFMAIPLHLFEES